MMALKDTLGDLSVLTAPGATVWGGVEGFHCMMIDSAKYNIPHSPLRLYGLRLQLETMRLS
jgi:hypothetical protein